MPDNRSSLTTSARRYNRMTGCRWPLTRSRDGSGAESTWKHRQIGPRLRRRSRPDVYADPGLCLPCPGPCGRSGGSASASFRSTAVTIRREHEGVGTPARAGSRITVQ